MNELCSINNEECSTSGRSERGWCRTHYQRWQKYDDPNFCTRDYKSHTAAHKNVTRKRGKASSHPCIDCGKPAEEWSYNNLDVDEIQGLDSNNRPRVWSMNEWMYDPRCRACHKVFDNNHRVLMEKLEKEMEYERN